MAVSDSPGGRMIRRKHVSKTARSDADLARLIERIARSAGGRSVICTTETGRLYRALLEVAGDLQLIAATPNADTYDSLARDGYDVIRLSVRVADKYRQARHAVSMAVTGGKVDLGDLVVCAVGHDLCSGDNDIVLVTDVETEAADIALSELVTLTDGVRADVLEATLKLACKIGRVSRRGRAIGTIFTLGDSVKVLEHSRQLILNPFAGHDTSDRLLTNVGTHDMLIEMAKLDGAFVVRGDGVIQSAAVYLVAPNAEVDVARGLGARHVAAAAVSARTLATAVVVSSTDGQVRVFSGGVLVLQIDPEVMLEPASSSKA